MLKQHCFKSNLVVELKPAQLKFLEIANRGVKKKKKKKKKRHTYSGDPETSLGSLFPSPMVAAINFNSLGTYNFNKLSRLLIIFCSALPFIWKTVSRSTQFTKYRILSIHDLNLLSTQSTTLFNWAQNKWRVFRLS